MRKLTRIIGILALLGGLSAFIRGLVLAANAHLAANEADTTLVFAIGWVLLMIGVATLVASFLLPAETTAVHCPECGQSFAGPSALHWHLQQVHGRTSSEAGRLTAGAKGPNRRRAR